MVTGVIGPKTYTEPRLTDGTPCCDRRWSFVFIDPALFKELAKQRV